MNRIMVIGSGGAGKSTFSRTLGEHLGMPVHHLDKYFWQPGWVQMPREEWHNFQKKLVEQDTWIIDGTYFNSIDLRLNRADTVIYLDFPSCLAVYRVLKRRLLYGGKTRPDMNEACPEQIDFDFVKWVMRFRRRDRPVILEKLKDYPDVKVLVFTKPKQAEAYLSATRR